MRARSPQGKGLPQVVVRPLQKPLHPALLVGAPREEEDGKEGVQGAEPLQDLQPLHIRQAPVQDHHVRPLLPYPL